MGQAASAIVFPSDTVGVSGPFEIPRFASPPQVTLDGGTILLPEGLRYSLGAIRAHMEAVALQRQRVLCVLAVDGLPVDLSRALPRVARFQSVTGETLGFSQLGRQLALTTRDQIAQLRARAEATALLVVINDWPQAQRLWWELLPDLKAPLLTLSFLPEICGDLSKPPLTSPLAEHVADLNRILDVINSVCSRGDALELSETLERQLLPWLDQLLKSVEKIYEVISP